MSQRPPGAAAPPAGTPTASASRGLRATTEAWAADFDSWDICDQATTSLFDLTPHAWPKAAEWAGRNEEWIRRRAYP